MCRQSIEPFLACNLQDERTTREFTADGHIWAYYSFRMKSRTRCKLYGVVLTKCLLKLAFYEYIFYITFCNAFMRMRSNDLLGPILTLFVLRC